MTGAINLADYGMSASNTGDENAAAFNRAVDVADAAWNERKTAHQRIYGAKWRQKTLDWQTIDTAPKDGTTIRVKREVDGLVAYDCEAVWRLTGVITHPITGLMLEGGRFYAAWMRADSDDELEPTHWMPA